MGLGKSLSLWFSHWYGIFSLLDLYGGLRLFDVALDQVFQAVCQEPEACDDVWNCPANCLADGNSNDEDVLGKCCQVLAIVDGLDLVDVWLDGVQHGGLICGDSHNLGRMIGWDEKVWDLYSELVFDESIDVV